MNSSFAFSYILLSDMLCNNVCFKRDMVSVPGWKSLQIFNVKQVYKYGYKRFRRVIDFCFFEGFSSFQE